MATPTSTNGVTARRLSSAITSLWTKVKNAFLLKTSSGAANGVASLDANGKVPTSQIPDSYRTFPKLNYFSHGNNEGTSNQFIKVAEIACNGRYLNHPIIFRLMARYQGQCIVYIQLENADTNYPGVEHFRVISPYDRGKSYATVKLTYVDNSTQRVYSLWVNPGTWTALESILEGDITSSKLVTMISGVYSTSLTNTVEPIYQKEIFTKNAGDSVGSTSVPVYVDFNGEVKPCTAPFSVSQLPSNSSSSAGIVASGSGQRYKVWKTDETGSPSWRNQSIVPELTIIESTQKSRLLYTIDFSSSDTWGGCSFMISLRHSGAASTGLYRLDVRYDQYASIPLMIRLYTVLPGSASLPSNVRMYYKYDSTTGIAYIYATLNSYNRFKMTPIYMSSYDMVSYSNTDVTTPNDAIQMDSLGYMLCSKPIGGPSTPVFVTSNGDLAECSNIPVIEHVTAIPSNPTVGTIYAL